MTAATTNKPTRRAMLGALALIPAIAAVPALAEAAQPEAEQGRDPCDMGDDWHRGYERGNEIGREIAMLHVAHGWIDRWKAAGGDFGLMYNADGSVRAVMHGWIEPSLWEPTDRDHAQLRPHEMLLQREHQPGAIKTLEALLTLVPGLSAAVHEAAGYPLLMASLRRDA